MHFKTTTARFGLLLSLLLGACGPGEPVDIPAVGDLVQNDYDFSGFSEIFVETFFEVEISQGSEYSVMIECEEALVPYLQVDVRGDRLVVGLESGYEYSFEDASHRVEIMLPDLIFVRIANHSTLQLDTFVMEEQLQLEVADFSTLNGRIASGDVSIQVSNHSTIILDGTAVNVVGEVTDMSAANLSGLETTSVTVETDENSTLRQ